MKKRVFLIILLCFTVLFSSLYAYNNKHYLERTSKYLTLAREELKRGNLEDARFYVEELLKVDPNNTKAAKLKISVLLQFSW